MKMVNKNASSGMRSPRSQDTYSLVRRVDTDDFIVFVDLVFVDPVRVQDTEVATPSADAFLGSSLQRPLVLQFGHTLVSGLAVDDT